jgi:hypothetical protein
MSDGNTANKNYYQRLAQEMAEADESQARYQQQLDRHWQTTRDLEEEDLYEVGGFLERWSTTSSYTKGRRDRDWRLR